MLATGRLGTAPLGSRTAATAGGPVADHLTVTTQPSSPIASGGTHATQPIVAVQDAGGSTVTTDTSTVTAALVVVTGSVTGLGTLTKAAVAGVANFSANGLGAVSAAGGTAKWRFTDGALTLAESSVFTITAAPAVFLTIAGLPVPVMEGQAVERIDWRGQSYRAFAGNSRTMVRAEKLAWAVTTGLMTASERSALELATAFKAHVACAGTGLPGTVTCEVTVSEVAEINTSAADGTGLLYLLALVLRAV